VVNRDLVEATALLMAYRDVALTKVKGHSGHPLNKQADRLGVLVRQTISAGD